MDVGVGLLELCNNVHGAFIPLSDVLAPVVHIDGYVLTAGGFGGGIASGGGVRGGKAAASRQAAQGESGCQEQRESFFHSVYLRCVTVFCDLRVADFSCAQPGPEGHS